jgi:hypothetical protein
MGWKATGTVTNVDTIATAVPLQRLTTEPNHQYAAALAAAADIITAAPGPEMEPGPWTVELKGSGQSYPTSRVSISVTGPVTSDPGAVVTDESWASHRGGILHSSAVDQMTFDDPTTDPNAEAQLTAAQAAGTELVASGTVGDIRPFSVELAGELSGSTWSVTVVVQRPVAEGYDSPG